MSPQQKPANHPQPPAGDNQSPVQDPVQAPGNYCKAADHLVDRQYSDPVRQIGVEEEADRQHGHGQIQSAQDNADNDDGGKANRGEHGPADDERDRAKSDGQHSRAGEQSIGSALPACCLGESPGGSHRRGPRRSPPASMSLD